MRSCSFRASRIELGHYKMPKIGSGSPPRNANRDEPCREYGEVRVQAIGQAGGDILFVVYPDRGDTRHLISARLANRKQRMLWQSFAAQWKTSVE